MKSQRSILLAVLLAVCVGPAASQPTADQSQLSTAAGQVLENLAIDLRGLSRVVALAPELGQARPLILALVDEDIDRLREPRGDGSFRWASLKAEEASRVKEEKSVEAVSTESRIDTITVSAAKAYRLMVTVPQKRSLVSANNRVFVRNALVDWTGFDGQSRKTEIPLNVWIEPGNSHSALLPDITKSAKVTFELAVESGSKKAVAEAALLQARLVDDPASPYFPAVRRLLQLRDAAASKSASRGSIRTLVDEATASLPGEWERSLAEQTARAEQRKLMLERGEIISEIRPGDASPDVIRTLHDAMIKLSGTLKEQQKAREELQLLFAKLQP